MFRICWFAVFLILIQNLPVCSQISVDLPFLRSMQEKYSQQEETDSNLLLIMAAERGDMDSVLSLIEKGLNVNEITGDGVTALMYASNNGSLEIAEVLVEHGADINAIPSNGITALSSACLNNHYDLTLFLLQQGADKEIADDYGITPLLYATVNDYYEITELLLMFGANPMHTDMEGATALHAAAIYAQPDIAWLLLDYGAEINSRDVFGFTPLMMAVQHGRYEMVDYLLKNNASINLRTKDGLSSLAIAIANNQIIIAEKLIELGANPKERISYTDNLMNLALWQGDEELISLVQKYNVRRNILPDFKTLRVSGNVLLNTEDFFNGLNATLEDHKYDLLITAGWYTRPVRSRILREYSEGWYDQLWEQRHMFFGGLHKGFPFRHAFSINEEGLYAGLNITYSKGHYWGTYRYPEPGWHLVPVLGYYKASSWWFYNIGYQYLQLNIHDKSAHFLKFEAGIRFGIKNDPVIYRTIYW